MITHLFRAFLTFKFSTIPGCVSHALEINAVGLTIMTLFHAGGKQVVEMNLFEEPDQLK